MTKKRVLFHSDFSRVKSGFGINAKAVLSHLYNTGKYEVFEYCCGNTKWSDSICGTTPWKSYGASPDDDGEIAHIQDPGARRMIHYGSWNIDRTIREIKPDVYIGCQDLWGMAGYWDKSWWNKIPCAIWTTLDSLPILPQAIEAAPKINNYWVWASFAEKALKKEGFNHVKTLPGMIDTKSFKPISKDDRLKLRRAFKIDDDCVIFGFVFRNQLRKLVGGLLQGLSEFNKTSKIKGKVLLHTNFSEGWNIPNYIKEFNIDPADVLTTYYCRACKNFYVVPYIGNGVECKICKTQNSSGNPTIVEGLDQKQLNLVYNLMDAYIHPMTSGGLEIPIAEAMLTGLPVATIPYSCGEEFTANKFVYPISYTTYRELGSNFIKATPVVSSIKSFMEKVAKNRELYKDYGNQGRTWALEYFNNDKIGKFIEDFIDKSTHSYDFNFSQKEKNSEYPNPDIQDDSEWLINLYKNILLMDETSQTEGVKHWIKKLEGGVSREQVYNYFIQEAVKFNLKDQKFDVKHFINKNDKKKLVYVIPGTWGDCVMSLNILKKLREDYEGWEIYVATKVEYNAVFEPFIGEYLDGLIPFHPVMMAFRYFEGGGHIDKIADIVFLPTILTQESSGYIHGGLDVNKLQRNTVEV